MFLTIFCLASLCFDFGKTRIYWSLVSVIIDIGKTRIYWSLVSVIIEMLYIGVT